MSDSTTTGPQITEIKPDLAKRIQQELSQNVYLCYQCVKCTSGCPMSQFFDWQPNQIMRALQFGQEEIALESQTPWLCASCQTCTTRCPQNIDIALIMDFLTQEATRRNIKPMVKEVDHFQKAFMNEVKLWGRAYELGLMVEMKLRTMDLFSDLDLGMKMIARNKISFIPHPSRAPKKAKPIQGAAQAVAYYPGCSLQSTAPELNTSTKAVCKALDIKLIEPKGWLCCGSSPAHKADPQIALELPMQNMRIFEQSGFIEVTMPCAACFNRHKAAQYEVKHHDARREEVENALDYEFQNTVKVNTLSQTILSHIGKEGVQALVKKPLADLKVVSYYGCLLTRPPEVTEAENPENPTDLDELVSALGAEPIDWSYKTSCCGASHSLTRPDIVLTLSREIIKNAKAVGADLIVVSCPLCHTNLDARQFQMKLESPMPILYFTQLMALSLGLQEKAMSFNKNLVDPRPLLRSKGYLG